ncbi:4-hydroxybenzoyl-CoA thioesterase [Microbacterium sp. Root53]|uniref:thioesterase family protein n=1 Tax=Microbacterium sp. Root53 TaxID=1736553 RepID=UPI0006F3EF59|nr:thioesterase family protein [Microbacterium sp. Root53]KQY96782.1 4-hydroxybenzoyl-CoA thioesterase [Microbacterium sp. Root53]
MNVIWRTLIVMLRARLRRRREGPLPMTAVGRVRLTTLPTDIDVLRHMNNGRYLSLFDLGRWDLMIRTDLMATMDERGWYPVVSSETVTFRKSLNLWQRFEVQTRWIGHDDRALYLEHRAVVRGEIYASAVIRARMLRRTGGTVPLEEVLAAVDLPDELPEVPAWLHEWAEHAALPSTRRPAPSDWR